MHTESKIKLPCIALSGPTAVGKSDSLAMLQSTIREFCSCDIEVVCADAFQAYIGLDIGTAKPDSIEQIKYSYKLIDILKVHEQYSAGKFCELAEAACRDIYSRGNVPVIEGGSVFYVYTFLTGMPDAPRTSESTRMQLQQDIEERGFGWLQEELARIDPAAAERIPASDRYRIQRAVEIFRDSGELPSTFLRRPALREDLQACVLGLERERAQLHERINRRVEGMFAAGLQQEFRSILDTGYGPGDPGLRAIGYQEFWRPDGSLETDMLDVSRRIQRNTRRLAKRQITFLQRIPGMETGPAESTGWIREELRTFAAELRKGLDLTGQR